MISPNYLFQRMPKGIKFIKARPVLTASPIQSNIEAVAFYGRFGDKSQYKLTLDDLGTNQYYPNLKVIIAGTGQIDGTWEIRNVDNSNDAIIIETYVEKLLHPIPINTGTCDLSGVIDHGINNTYQEVKNNDGKVIGFGYTDNQSFILDYEKDFTDDSPIGIQLNVVDNGTVTGTIKWSLDEVNWMDFATPLVLSADNTESCGILLTDLPTNVKLRIDITATRTLYYLLAA